MPVYLAKAGGKKGAPTKSYDLGVGKGKGKGKDKGKPTPGDYLPPPKPGAVAASPDPLEAPLDASAPQMVAFVDSIPDLESTRPTGGNCWTGCGVAKPYAWLLLPISLVFSKWFRAITYSRRHQPQMPRSFLTGGKTNYDLLYKKA